MADNKREPFLGNARNINTFHNRYSNKDVIHSADGEPSVTTIEDDTALSVPEYLHPQRLPNYDDDDAEFRIAQELRSAQQTIFNYSQENNRLKTQLKAAALRERLLNDKVTSLLTEKRTVEREKEEMQESVMRLNTELEGKCYSQTRTTKEHMDALHGEIEALKKHITSLEVNERELTGRLAAYESTIHTAFDKENGLLTDGSTLKEVACEALSLSGYLVKVVNACQHCHCTPHRTVKDTRFQKEFSSSVCAKDIHTCRKRCLVATSEGNVESNVMVKSRGVGADLDELLHALREELLYCESVCIQLSSYLLSSEMDNPSAVFSHPTEHNTIQIDSNTPLAEKKATSIARSYSGKRGSSIENENCEVQ
ncbi:hypothetical protein ADEAN_000458300 [Angomonas deanei]|uniref:Uncharacterized protein n=1 Tax=Angomonas deanei TaxID=59799 RepID=A0A7G2CCE2_9TRYP|nr:hypothetical protein ADEAN_000458300 [Angomonas deanei]